MNTKKRAVIGRKVTTTNLDELITKNSGNNIVERSPISERDIEWERVEIESQDVLNKCRKSIYNKRSFKDLSLASVLDIYHSIKSTGGNTEAVRAELVDGKYEILGGLRRAYTVSLLPNTKLTLVVAKNLTEEERAHFALVMDEYSEPSYMDKARSISELKDKLEKRNGIELTGTKLCEILGMKKSNVYYALSFSNIPNDIIKLFPALKFISTPFLRELVKYNKDGYLDHLASHFKAIETSSLTGNESKEELTEIDEYLEKESKKLQRDILNKIKNDKTEGETDYNGKFKELIKSNVRGIKFTTKKNGVNISIDESEVSPDILEMLLTSFNS